MMVLHKFEDMDESLSIFVENAGMVCIYLPAHLFADVFEPFRLQKQGLAMQDSQEEMVDCSQGAVLVLPKWQDSWGRVFYFRFGHDIALRIL